MPVVQAASYSKYLGEFKVAFDDNGVVKEAKGDPIFLDKSITPDAAVLARIKELGAPIEELKNKEVSETTEADRRQPRQSAAPRNARWAIWSPTPSSTASRTRASRSSFQNGGGLRASIDQGVVTMGEVLTVLPFQNTLATFQITGKDIVAALENGVSQLEEGKGQFPQVAGLKYSFDKSVAPNGGRIKSVEVMEGGAWAPIDPAKTYHRSPPTTTSRQGGDGYKLFADNAQNAYDYGPGLEQVVADYLAAQPALHAEARRPHHRDRARRGAGARPKPAEPADRQPAETAAAAPDAAEPPAGSARHRHAIVAGRHAAGTCADDVLRRRHANGRRSPTPIPATAPRTG